MQRYMKMQINGLPLVLRLEADDFMTAGNIYMHWLAYIIGLQINKYHKQERWRRRETPSR